MVKIDGNGSMKDNIIGKHKSMDNEDNKVISKEGNGHDYSAVMKLIGIVLNFLILWSTQNIATLRRVELVKIIG